MILTAALALSSVSVAVVGEVNTSDLSKWLGPTYSISRYGSLSQAAAARPQVLIVDRVPASSGWAAGRDEFVPSFERELANVHRQDPKTRLFLLLPGNPPTGFSADVYSSEVIPLLQQAATETGVETIEVKGSATEAEEISDSIYDFSAQKAGWKLVAADSEETDEGPAVNAIDGKLDTYWHTQYSPTNTRYPHQITVDMGRPVSIAGFRYVPRQDGGTNGRVKKFEFYVSQDGSSWGEAAVSGELPNTPRATAVHFKSPQSARYFKFVALSEQFGGPWATAAEIDVLPAP